MPERVKLRKWKDGHELKEELSVEDNHEDDSLGKGTVKKGKNKNAKWSIFIAILGLVVTIIFGVLSLFDSKKDDIKQIPIHRTRGNTFISLEPQFEFTGSNSPSNWDWKIHKWKDGKVIPDEETFTVVNYRTPRLEHEVYGDSVYVLVYFIENSNKIIARGEDWFDIPNIQTPTLEFKIDGTPFSGRDRDYFPVDLGRRMNFSMNANLDYSDPVWVLNIGQTRVQRSELNFSEYLENVDTVGVTVNVRVDGVNISGGVNLLNVNQLDQQEFDEVIVDNNGFNSSNDRQAIDVTTIGHMLTDFANSKSVQGFYQKEMEIMNLVSSGDIPIGHDEFLDAFLIRLKMEQVPGQSRTIQVGGISKDENFRIMSIEGYTIL